MNYPKNTAKLSSERHYDNLPDDTLIRSKQLVNSGLVPFSLPTLWRKTKDQSFPPAVRVSDGITAWRLGDIRTWLKDPKGSQWRNA